jgi:hypothetical protein
MGRKNSTNRRPQAFKHRVEDRMARRALERMVDESYREEARQDRYEPGGQHTIVFTDPSFYATA